MTAVVIQTCVMSTVHSSMVVADSIQIIQEVRRSRIGTSGLLPSWLKRGLVRAAVAVHHVRCHVQPHQGEMDKSGELVPPLTHLPEAL